MKFELKDLIQIIVMVTGFAMQTVSSKNDIDWIKQTLVRHDQAIERLLAKGEK